MNLVLNESQYKQLSLLLNENSSDDYDDEDFIELGVFVFRDWVKKNVDSKISKYPLSYLMSNYFEKFKESLGIDVYTYGGSYRKLEKAGREILKKGIKKLPSLQSKVKFTKKFQKPFSMALRQIKLPEFLKLNVTEDEPYVLSFNFELDYVKMLQSDVEYRGYTYYYTKITDFMETFMGTKFGKTVHGDVKVYPTIKVVGQDQFIEKFKKEIRPEIRKLPGYSNVIHSIGISAGERFFNLEPRYQSYSGWSSQNKFKEEIFNLWVNLGYNRNKLKINK
jgi:hypothetical protein